MAHAFQRNPAGSRATEKPARPAHAGPEPRLSVRQPDDDSPDNPSADDAPVSQAAVSREPLPCSACGAFNAPAAKFCTQCGKSLWQPCPKCSVLSRATERFCGNCGANLTDTTKALVREYIANLRKAQTLHREFRYGEALDLLGQMLAIQYSYLAEQITAAKRLMEQITLDQERAANQIQQIEQQARDALEANQYAAAERLLTKIPEPLRPEPLQSLLAELTEKREAQDRLELELEAAAAEGGAGKILRVVNQLLEIHPNHDQAIALARRIALGLRKAAGQWISQCRYDSARQALALLPEAARDATCQQLLDQARELEWLAADLRQSPYLDAVLPHVAERLAKLAPHDPAGPKARHEIHRRKTAAGAAATTTITTWAKAPETTYVGMPVEWLTRFRRIEDQATGGSEHPGAFFVAAGLALHTIKQASVPLTLEPKDNENMLLRLARYMPTWSANEGWGLDLGNAALKAVRLQRNAETNKVSLVACDYVDYRKPLGQAYDENEQHMLITDAIRRWLANHQPRRQPVCVGLPGNFALTRSVVLPPVEVAKLEATVRYEARQLFSLSSAELAMTYHVFEKTEQERLTRPEHSVVMLAAKRQRLAAIQSNLEQAGLQVAAIQSDSIALHNLLQFEFGPGEPGAAAPPVLLFDIGGEGSQVVVSGPRFFWNRSINVGADRFTRSLTQELEMGFTAAEELKRKPHEAESMAKVAEVIEPTFDDFAHELQTSLAAVPTYFGLAKPDRVLCAGGGFQTHGLLRYLCRGPSDSRPVEP